MCGSGCRTPNRPSTEVGLVPAEAAQDFVWPEAVVLPILTVLLGLLGWMAVKTAKRDGTDRELAAKARGLDKRIGGLDRRMDRRGAELDQIGLGEAEDPGLETPAARMGPE